jgi:hypothetical protein
VSVSTSLAWACVVLGVLVSLGCASTSENGAGADEPLPVAVIETLNTLHLVANDGQGGLARQLLIELSIEPKMLGIHQIVGRGPEGGLADDALIQLTVSWKDFVGLTNTSFGGRQSRPTVFGDGGEASFGAPFRRTFELELNTPQPGVLARRVQVSARLHPLDVISEVARSAGARMEFPEASIETLSRQPAGSLSEWFEEGAERDPEELFLSAASTPIDRRPQVLARLIGSLASLNRVERDAGFGALHFLTGATNGRSVYAWEAWLREQPTTGVEQSTTGVEQPTTGVTGP